ncbi:MAG: hypothetical protein H0V95_13630 [Actinobacteria bacterium]|nr:hypothetical protein [Actinomycetota bacterium]
MIVEALASAPARAVAVAELLASELVAAAVRHGSPRLAFAVHRQGDSARIEVAEQTAEVDKAAIAAIDPAPEEEWSTRILEALARRHGREMRSDGMMTWVEIDIR